MIGVRKAVRTDALWSRLAGYAQSCSWVAGPHLAGMLRENRCSDWEAVFAAMDGERIVGFCTFLKTDYKKYGFELIDRLVNYGGDEDNVFMKRI